MRIRFGAVFLALIVAVMVAGCGGGGDKKAPSVTGGTTPAGADYVPTAAVGFVSIVTDSNSKQWNAGRDLLGKFPGKDRLIASIQQSFAKQQLDYAKDVEPAVGAEVDIGLLGLQGNDGQVIGLTQPDDPSALEALLGKLSQGGTKTVFKRIGEWTAASDAQSALDASASAKSGSSLVDNTSFAEAMTDLPADAIARMWFDGAALTRTAQTRTGGTGSIPGYGRLVSVAAALGMKSDGVTINGVVKTDKDISAVKKYSSKLISQVPAGVLAYLSFASLDDAINAIAAIPSVKQQLGQFEAQLGVTLAELAPLFAGEGAVYVRQGVPIPEITIVLEQSNEASARTTADKLFTRVAPALQGQVTSTTVSGVSLKQITGQNFSIYYGVFDGKLVVTDSTTGIAGLRDSGQKLADDALFTGAGDAAGMPDETAGFLYVNLKDAIPLIENLLTSFGGNIDPAMQQNLDPLKSFLVFASVDGPKATFSGFVGVE
jgi:Protein of unknown function (DUF3352)